MFGFDTLIAYLLGAFSVIFAGKRALSGVFGSIQDALAPLIQLIEQLLGGV